MHLKNETDSTARKDRYIETIFQKPLYQHQICTINVYIVYKYYARVFGVMEITHQNS